MIAESVHAQQIMNHSTIFAIGHELHKRKMIMNAGRSIGAIAHLDTMGGMRPMMNVIAATETLEATEHGAHR